MFLSGRVLSLVLAVGVQACQPAPKLPEAASPATAPPVPAASVGAPGAEAEARATFKRSASTTRVFHLHKMLRKVGIEIDTFVPNAQGGFEAKAAFAFQDRGTHVPLAAAFEIAADGTPLRYTAWGSSSRSSSLDDRVTREADGTFSVVRLGEAARSLRPRSPFVIASGYAPVLAQDLMLRSWVQQGRPASLALLPAGTVQLESRGTEHYELEGQKLALEHVGVSGLVWGREDAWLDEHGELVALATRDAEFDLFQVAREGFVGLLPALVARSGADGIAWLAEVAGSAERRVSGVVALVGATLVGGKHAAPLADSAIIYSGNEILAVGPRASTPVPPGATVIDLAGKTIIPGLWDMHAHVQQVEQGASYLAAGVTTVRDLGNVLEFVTGVRDTIDAGKGLGPRILVSGLVDGDGARALGTLNIKTQAEIAPLLDGLKRAGCLEVKIYSSVAPALVKSIVVEAHRRGLRVTGHVPEGMNVLQALDAGFDGINHVSFLPDVLFAAGERQKLSGSLVRRRIAEADLTRPPLRTVIDAFVRRKVVLDDTLALYELLNHSADENARREPALAKLPPELVATIPSTRPDEAVERGQVFQKYLAIVAELHRRGVPIVAGTDIAVPGHSLHRELELYVEAGFSPLEALQAATLVPARVAGLDALSGTVEPGKRADLVVIEGNPLTDIRSVRNVELVVARGKIYDPAALWRLVGFTP